MNNNKKRRVVITGIGVVNSAGNGKNEFWENCLTAKSNVKYIPEEWNYYNKFFSTLWSPLPKIDFVKEGIDKVEQMQSDKNQILTMITARQAFKDANINYTLKDKKKKIFLLDNNLSENFGVYIGTGNGGITSLIENAGHHFLIPYINDLKSIRTKIENGALLIDEIIEFINVLRLFNRFSVAMTMPNASSAKVGIKYSLTGPNNTFCGACASGTIAIGNTYRAIKNGNMDIALTGGVEFFGDPYGLIFRAFDAAKTLVQNCDDPETANRPFDEKRSGFLFSEGGCAMFILEEMQHALQRNAKIYAEISGYAETYDAYNIMMIDPKAKEIEKMIANLLKQDNLKPKDIDYINAHGTGTKTNDSIEAQVIESIFGKDVLVNSTKSVTGHTIGASGAIEACVTALSIKNKTTHISKNLKNPIADLNFVREVDHYNIRRAMSQSFAFGGHNAAILFEEFRN